LEVSVKVICDLPITATWHITLQLLLSESSRKRPSNKVYDTALTTPIDTWIHCSVQGNDILSAGARSRCSPSGGPGEPPQKLITDTQPRWPIWLVAGHSPHILS